MDLGVLSASFFVHDKARRCGKAAPHIEEYYSHGQKKGGAKNT